MTHFKGGAAYLDLTFVTAADMITLLGGTAIIINKSVFDNAKNIVLCAKPLYAVLPFIATSPGEYGEISYMLMDTPTNWYDADNDEYIAFSTTISGTRYQLRIYEDSGVYKMALAS